VPWVILCIGWFCALVGFVHWVVFVMARFELGSVGAVGPSVHGPFRDGSF
jgi:hypothetical protein